MQKLTRTPYNTTLNSVLLKKLKILAAEQEKRHNDLLEEAIADILQKYGKKVSKKIYLTPVEKNARELFAVEISFVNYYFSELSPKKKLQV